MLVVTCLCIWGEGVMGLVCIHHRHRYTCENIKVVEQHHSLCILFMISTGLFHNILGVLNPELYGTLPWLAYLCGIRASSMPWQMWSLRKTVGMECMSTLHSHHFAHATDYSSLHPSHRKTPITPKSFVWNTYVLLRLSSDDVNSSFLMFVVPHW